MQTSWVVATAAVVTGKTDISLTEGKAAEACNNAFACTSVTLHWKKDDSIQKRYNLDNGGKADFILTVNKEADLTSNTCDTGSNTRSLVATNMAVSKTRAPLPSSKYEEPSYYVI
ncbi:hypothetical protein SCAR479_00543 [Seiridium cardinale]|uniref:Ig-like domain-containing protein n=1 Tax=Seiridium cardinale TaxID=138064 RepID=A0ABR2Y9T8_9PEZI